MAKIKRVSLPAPVKPQRVTVKELAVRFDLKPVQVRKILRANQICPKLVEVDGWPNQKRVQYVWLTTDPELKQVLAAIHEVIAPEEESDLLK